MQSEPECAALEENYIMIFKRPDPLAKFSDAELFAELDMRLKKK